MIARAWFWWLDYVYVTYWQLRHVLGRFDAERWHRGELTPVLLLPGVYETWQFLRPIAERLNAAGHPVHIVRELGYNREAIPDAAAVAQRYLDGAGLTDVIVVAHSKGGLIGKHMMLFDDTAQRIACMVAIATPFSGSVYARYFLNRPIRAFRPNEPTLARLSANAEANARITSVFGIFDPHIPASSRLEGASNVRLPVYGHFRILSDERVIGEVEKAIASAGSQSGVD